MRKLTILGVTAAAAAVFAALASAGPAVHRHDMATTAGIFCFTMAVKSVGTC